MIRRRLLTAIILVGVAAATLRAHDLFLIPASFFVRPGSSIVVRVPNGTFDTSEAPVAANRIQDLTLVSPRGRSPISRDTWKAAGTAAEFTVRADFAGTYLIGASTLPRTIHLDAKQFNQYLSEDGIPDVLFARKRLGEETLAASERYSKHVKAIVQAGSARTAGFEAVLGYPAEIIPLSNPYALRVGTGLRVRAEVDGKPVGNQLLLFGGRNTRGGKLAERSVRTNSDGTAQIPIVARGNWYVKFIHMTKVAHDSVDYESKWATLTFGVR